MDSLKGNLLENDDLEAYVHGLPILVPGVNNTAIEVDSEKSITVSGPGHRAECFGDLTKCNQGTFVVDLSNVYNYLRCVINYAIIILFEKFVVG